MNYPRKHKTKIILRYLFAIDVPEKISCWFGIRRSTGDIDQVTHTVPLDIKTEKKAVNQEKCFF